MADNDGPSLTAAGDLPGDLYNGFTAIVSELLKGAERGAKYVTVTVWQAGSTTINHRKGNATRQALAVVSVEILRDADADQAMAMHDAAFHARTDDESMPKQGALTGGDGADE